MTPTPRRRWFRFGLRTMFIVVTVIAVLLGCWGNRARRQKLAVASIQALDPEGTIYYDFQAASDDFDPDLESRVPPLLLSTFGKDFFHNVSAVFVTADREEVITTMLKLRGLKFVFLSEPSKSSMRRVATLPNLERLVLGLKVDFDLENVWFFRFLKWLGGESQQQAAPEGPLLTDLPVLPNLTGLHSSLSNADSTAAHIARFTRLEVFSTDGDSYSNVGLQQLASLRHLKVLLINAPGVTDDGLPPLLQLTELEHLTLGKAQVTAEGLTQLKALPKLRELVIPKSLKNDLPTLRTALPNCSISIK